MAKKNLNLFWAEIIIEELIRNGIDYFCICPGSRSTPLVLAIAENAKAQSVTLIDERGAGFHALGYAKAANKPAVIVTTSGTAVANLYPAVIEASQDHVPMIILSADRPLELIDTAANQTINQVNIFGQYTRYAFDFPTPTEDFPPEAVLSTVDQAVYQSRNNNPGPVHLNCRYRKPLEAPGATAKPTYMQNITTWLNDNNPYTHYVNPIPTIDDSIIKILATDINRAKRPMILVGKINSDPDRKAALAIINKLNCTVYADITSGLRLTDCPTHIMRYFDQELLSAEFNTKTKPDLILHLGSRITSKRVNEYLDQNRPTHYILIKDNPNRLDPIHIVTRYIQADLPVLTDNLVKQLKPKANNYSRFFTQKAKAVDQLIADSINNEEILSEAFIARQISTDIPDHSNLFLSNSMPIRDMDLYSQSGLKKITVSANRGVSGIDGIISSAIGFAQANKKTTTLIIGDLAFMHDINALATLKKLNLPFVIVLINNGGGGIFHFLPVSKCDKDIFQEHFAASHQFTFAGACNTFGINHCQVSDKQGFINAYRKAIKKSSPTVIEAITNRVANLKSRRDIKKKIINLLDKEINK
ncbi:MAG: 2-succinyl-5-enolpyruvyl-6-hydroxy-3-cyclohexene-1-carboxylic-acid synthase [Phycisphaerae bacterium]|nr:2-succinyl-5-enolpyruvyl-6-hydroxy-3-cyclohexene-1-carboxylic-acid synthase [Phycisphaerae bacterium]